MQDTSICMVQKWEIILWSPMGKKKGKKKEEKFDDYHDSYLCYQHFFQTQLLSFQTFFFFFFLQPSIDLHEH